MFVVIMCLTETKSRQGKKQTSTSSVEPIVMGLLCDEAGEPVSVEVFRGNTADVATFGAQVRKVAERFGCQHVTFVGDRGMIKTAQTSASSVEPIEDLSRAGFHYITALTKPQIEALLRRGTLQMELFDETVCEVESDDIRYVLRRNAHRADDLAATRRDKRQTVQRLVEKKNACVQELTLPGRKERVHNIPRPRHLSEKLIRAAGVRLPKAPPSRSAARLSSPKSELAAGRDDPVVTKRTLSPRRTEP